jgi:glycosyltransferase involved in cell wall biosynthesis
MGDPEEIRTDPVSGGDAGDVAPVSVVIITLNENGTSRLLASLAQLDYPAERYEVIVVDVHGRDTGDRGDLRRGQGHPLREGYSRQKNAGLRARGSVLAFTDADCRSPEWLRTIDRPSGTRRAAGESAYPPPGTSRFGLWSACVGHPAGGAIGLDANFSQGADGIDFIPGCNSVYRRGVLQDVGGFGPDFEDGGEDVDISRRLRAKGYFFDYVPDLFVYHKPRPTLRAFLRWNIGVGVTKYNLIRPTLPRILLEAGSPLWPAAFLGGLLVLPGFPWPHVIAIVVAWAALVSGLFLGTRPYPLLLKRRRRIGVSVVAALTVVPLLIAVRQAAMNVGMLRKRRRAKKKGS